MKRLVALLFASLLVVGLAGRPAAASTFDLGTITPGDDTTGFVANFGTGIVSFEDTIKFSLSFISTSLVGAVQDISFAGIDSVNFQLDLFNESDPATSLGTFTDLSGTTLAFSYLNLAAGDYFFRVMGDTGPGGNIYKYPLRRRNRGSDPGRAAAVRNGGRRARPRRVSPAQARRLTRDQSAARSGAVSERSAAALARSSLHSDHATPPITRAPPAICARVGASPPIASSAIATTGTRLV